jgi:cell division inhibitor SepF
MNFWDNLKNLTNPMADEDYSDFEDEMETLEEEPRQNQRMPRREARPEAAAGTERAENGNFNGKVLSMNSNKPSVVLFRPTSLNDAKKAADDLKNRKAVIVNLENVDPDMARRVVDFISGCAYALGGKFKKIAASTYLFCPQSMDVMGDLETLHPDNENSID